MTRNRKLKIDDCASSCGNEIVSGPALIAVGIKFQRSIVCQEGTN